MHIGTKSIKLDITTEIDTKKLAENLSNFLKKGDIVFLFGEMGTGKTTFVKYLINSMQKKIMRIFLKFKVLHLIF